MYSRIKAPYSVNNAQPQHHLEYSLEESFGLPNVDDLEVAADAADVGELNIEVSHSESEESSLGDKSNEVGPQDPLSLLKFSLLKSLDALRSFTVPQESTSDCEEHYLPAADNTLVTVSLNVAENETICVELNSRQPAKGLYLTDESSESEIEEIENLRNMMEAWEEGGEDQQAAERESAIAVSKLAVPSAAPFHVKLLSTDTLLPAGEVTAKLEVGHSVQLVVKGEQSSRMIDEGSVVFLEDGAAVGRVEELFGPIEEPFFFVLLHPGSPLLPRIHPKTRLSSVHRLNTYVLPEELAQVAQAKAADCDSNEEAEGSGSGEDDFMDAETVLQRQVAPANGASGLPASHHRKRAGHSGRARQRRGRGRPLGQPRLSPGRSSCLQSPRRASHGTRPHLLPFAPQIATHTFAPPAGMPAGGRWVYEVAAQPSFSPQSWPAANSFPRPQPPLHGHPYSQAEGSPWARQQLRLDPTGFAQNGQPRDFAPTFYPRGLP